MNVPVDIIEPCGFPFGDRSLKRAAMDYGARADVTRHANWEAFREARAKNRVIVTSAHAKHSIWAFEWQADDIILMGSESSGIDETVRSSADKMVTIPMPGGGRSLNVSAAAAMTLGEALRQTR